MSIGKTIRKIREQKGITQQQLAELVNMHRSNYSKVEAGERELSVTALAKVAKHFGMTLDELVNFKGKVPTEEKIEDKTAMEQLKLISGLDEEDKAMVFRLIDTIITKKKFKDFVATMQ
jgi:transcriptional regulator with XRE-family HTH domain